MTTFHFLSAEWIAAAEALYEEYVGQLRVPDEHVRINVTVTDVPFDEDVIYGHIDTQSGNGRPRIGHLDEPEAHVTVPYSIAHMLFVTREMDLVMQAFMTGKIDLEGDVTRLLYLQDLEPTEEQQTLGLEIGERLTAFTKDT